MPGWQSPCPSLRQMPGDCWLTWRAGRSHSGRQHPVSPPPTSAAPSPPLELPPGPCNNNRLTHGLCFVYDLWILRWGNYFSIFRLNLRKLSETTTRIFLVKFCFLPNLMSGLCGTVAQTDHHDNLLADLANWKWIYFIANIPSECVPCHGLNTMQTVSAGLSQFGRVASVPDR